MRKFRRKPETVFAVQWLKLGDHPDVLSDNHAINYKCKRCNGYMREHGRIEMQEGDYTVCPSDWIVTNKDGKVYSCNDSVFRKTHEEVWTKEELEAAEIRAKELEKLFEVI